MIIKIEKSFLAAVLVILGVVVIWFILAHKTLTPSQVPAVAPATQGRIAPVSAGVLPAKEVNGGEVSVAVTPLTIGESESIWKFQVATNTHTVDMSGFDPTRQVALVGANGKDVLPSNVQREGEGHHQTLTVSFVKVEKPWKIIVRNVAGVPAREFAW